MSYDVHLEVDLGGPRPVMVADWMNYTYNCGPMFRLALFGSTEVSDENPGLNWLDGKVAGEVVPALRAAVEHMEDNPERYRRLNPENLWGHYEGALQFLIEILTACELAPRSIVRVT